MDRFEKGMLVRSKAGHDAGEIFIITGTEDAYVYLADVDYARYRNQKRKRRNMCRSYCSNMIYRMQTM